MKNKLLNLILILILLNGCVGASSKGVFASLSRSFSLDQLDFYTKDFYYPFRNNLITKFIDDIVYLLSLAVL